MPREVMAWIQTFVPSKKKGRITMKRFESIKKCAEAFDTTPQVVTTRIRKGTAFPYKNKVVTFDYPFSEEDMEE